MAGLRVDVPALSHDNPFDDLSLPEVATRRVIDRRASDQHAKLITLARLKIREMLDIVRREQENKIKSKLPIGDKNE